MQKPRLFSPWAPQHARFRGLRVLVIGESHYDEGERFTAAELESFTRDIVRRWGVENHGYQRFFASVYAAFTGRARIGGDTEYTAFWRAICFYNYVQELVPGGPGQRPPSSAFALSAGAFWQTLEELKPQAIVVFGRRVWDAMPTDRAEKTGAVEGVGDVWAYSLSDGQRAFAIHTPHPASRGFSASRYHEPIVRFLDAVGAGDFGQTA
jgi:hypothetical protein